MLFYLTSDCGECCESSWPIQLRKCSARYALRTSLCLLSEVAWRSHELRLAPTARGIHYGRSYEERNLEGGIVPLFWDYV